MSICHTFWKYVLGRKVSTDITRAQCIMLQGSCTKPCPNSHHDFMTISESLTRWHIRLWSEGGERGILTIHPADGGCQGVPVKCQRHGPEGNSYLTEKYSVLTEEKLFCSLAANRKLKQPRTHARSSMFVTLIGDKRALLEGGTLNLLVVIIKVADGEGTRWLFPFSAEIRIYNVEIEA